MKKPSKYPHIIHSFILSTILHGIFWKFSSRTFLRICPGISSEIPKNPFRNLACIASDIPPSIFFFQKILQRHSFRNFSKDSFRKPFINFFRMSHKDFFKNPIREAARKFFKYLIRIMFKTSFTNFSNYSTKKLFRHILRELLK